MKKRDNIQRTMAEKCREFVSFMLCRQAEEIASYAHAMLVAGIITDADMDELNKSIVMAFGLTADEAVANVRADGPWSDGRAGGFEARVRRGRRPDCAIWGGGAWNEDLLTLDLGYNGESLARVHIASIAPREKDL